MALQANSTDVYRGGVLVEAPALPKGPKASLTLTLRREARLAYTILTPTLPAKALDECHKKIAEIYGRYEKG
jgi:hypothetical protein